VNKELYLLDVIERIKPPPSNYHLERTRK